MRNHDTSSEPGPPPADYVACVNRAIDHVVTGLDRPLRLDDLAGVAGFSPFHFHRIFGAIVGETPAQFVTRLRLERALTLMARRPARSLTQIALECGFSSSSDFSRSFKKRYGRPPSSFDTAGASAEKRAELDRLVETGTGGRPIERLPPGENPDGFIAELVDLPARRLAYRRVLDPYRPDAVTGAAAALVAWAEERGLAGGSWYGYIWDDPDVVALKDCRYDVAVEAGDAPVAGEVGAAEFPPMRVAQVTVRGGIELEMRALDWLYRTWLPGSGFVPDDLPCFEAWIGRPFAHGTEHFELHVQIPIRRG